MPQNVQDSPMEVDVIDLTDSSHELLSNESKPINIFDFVDLTYQGSTPVLVKKEKLSSEDLIMARKSKKKLLPKPKRRYFTKTNFFIFLVVVLAVYIYDQLNYNHELELTGFQYNLRNSLVGQTQVANDLTEALYSFQRGSELPEKHLLGLIGTMGVGKTYCVNAIKRKFKPKQIVEINIDSITLDNYRDYLNLHKSVPYLVILDNLSYKHVKNIQQILQWLPENKWVLVVTVFNIQETEDFKTFTVNDKLYDVIPQELFSHDFIEHFVKFNSFDLNFLDLHMEELKLVYANILQDIPNWEEIIRKHDFKTFGFKGLFEKLNILGK